MFSGIFIVWRSEVQQMQENAQLGVQAIRKDIIDSLKQNAVTTHQIKILKNVHNFYKKLTRDIIMSNTKIKNTVTVWNKIH